MSARFTPPCRIGLAPLLALALVLLAACGPGQVEAPSVNAPKSAAQPAVASFVVRFREPHPLARAQALEAAGQCEQAQQLARETIAARADLAGLCFDRFTLGGAEIVLKACAPISPDEAEAFQRTWVERFATMDGVEYADANLVVTPAECP